MRHLAAIWGGLAIAVLGCGTSNRATNGDAAVPDASAADTAVGADARRPGDAATDAGCSTQDTVLNTLSVRVHGTLTLNGGPYPPEVLPYVRLYFDTGESTAVALSAAGTYDVALAPGRYDVDVGQSICDSLNQCYSGRVATAVDIEADGQLDFDLAWNDHDPVDVSGTVTINGAPVAFAAGAYATLAFIGGPGPVTPFAIAPDGTFVASLEPGVYDVRYQGDSPDSSGWLCGLPVLRGQVVAKDQPLALDFKSVVLEGRVTVDGAAVTATPAGSVVATDPTSQFSCSVVPQSDGTYAFSLSPGHYDLTWAGDNQSCAGPLPCNSGVLRTDVAVTGPTHLDLDAPAVHVRGTVTVNGAPMPDDVVTRGTLMIGQVRNNFGTSGAATYDVVLFPGAYDVTWIPATYFQQRPKAGRWDCSMGQGTPCNDGVIQAAVPFVTDETKDIDIPVVQVHGVVTKNGAAIPEVTADGNAGARGVVTFARPDGMWRAEIPIPDMGSATYAGPLLGGAGYVQSWAPGPNQRSIAGCGVEQALGLPCQEGVLQDSLALPPDGALDAPLETFRIAGHVTLNGGGWSGAGVPDGIGFMPPPATSLSPSAEYPLTPGSDGLDFDVELIKGRYVGVLFPPRRSDACAAPATGVPSDVPCNREILVPCWSSP